jgi:hypothetical protein
MDQNKTDQILELLAKMNADQAKSVANQHEMKVQIGGLASDGCRQEGRQRRIKG